MYFAFRTNRTVEHQPRRHERLALGREGSLYFGIATAADPDREVEPFYRQKRIEIFPVGLAVLLENSQAKERQVKYNCKRF